MKQSTLFSEHKLKILPELDLHMAANLVEKVKSTVQPHCVKIDMAGSIRRQKSKVHDIDFVVATKNNAEWQKVSDKLKQLKTKLNCEGNAIIKALVPFQNGHFQVDFYRANPSTFGILLLIRTGSAEHKMWLAGFAQSKGMQLKYNQGLLKNGNVIAGEDETSVFKALGVIIRDPQKHEIVDDKPLWQERTEQTENKLRSPWRKEANGEASLQRG
jgi:DNA polymerase/3'-5' exonuclease PolX